MSDHSDELITQSGFDDALALFSKKILIAGREFSTGQFAQNWAHREVTNFPEGRKFTAEERAQVRDLIDLAAREGFFEVPPASGPTKEEPVPQNESAVSSPPNRARLESIVADVFETTVDGSAARANYLAEVARGRLSDELERLKLSKESHDHWMRELTAFIEAQRKQITKDPVE